MYVFVKKRIVRREVEIKVPKDGTGFDPQKIFVTWEIVPSTEASHYDEAFFQKVIQKIEGVAEEANPGVEIAYTPEFRDAFIAVSYHLSALQREYLNCTIAAGRGN